MSIFEEEQAARFGMEIAERLNSSDDQGFLRWTGQNPDWRDYTVAMLQSIFPRAFKAVQESDISVYIKDGKALLHHDVAERFTVSKFSRPAMWGTQSVVRNNHVEAFKQNVMASRGWWDLMDNPASNHFMNWAISKMDDAVLKFVIGIRLNMLRTPRIVKRDGDRDIQCCWCPEKNPGMAHIICNCLNGHGFRYMNKRHRAIVDAVAAAVREGIKGVHIREDERIGRICAEMTDDEGALKRPDLMYESFITKKTKTKKIFSLTEITSPWTWEHSLERAYQKKVEKYEPVRIRFHQLNSEYHEVRLNIIVVSPSGVFPMQSQKDFAIATMLPRNRLAAHARCVVDATIYNAYEHYGAYCKPLALKESVKGATAKYTVVGEEFKEELEHMEVVDSIRDVDVSMDVEALAYEDGQMTNIELRKQSEIEQAVCESTGIERRALHPHPDGWKQDGDDGKEDIFGKAYTRV
jgi:hypothetical protein